MLYSVEQVADLLGLHVKTVRGYVHDGRLKAVKVGKQYRISGDDLAAFTGQDVSRRHVEVSGIVQVDDVDFAEMGRISAMVMAFVATPYDDERLRVETIHDQDRASLKIIVVGGLTRTADLLKFIKTITE
ncbi:helix-turn-helix domain-containing protein [Actinocrispum wychmicini]|uniref:Excisionase family DNA binding protein n=1 Tax=Actinocrispum wychmicini TaxID=1213861 RepID=A0A4R2J5Y3_9PSEU|nr:helix-turn-helix domain-containing protein [Actinocrispum wychmicini]TCO52862.1 excisionase family DNA binding protein [Actinocrispum wychmicini]